MNLLDNPGAPFTLAMNLARTDTEDFAPGPAAVVRTLAAEDGRHGGCMAQLGESVAEATGLDCPGRWVTFGCSGEHVSKAAARRLYDAAQLAFASGRRAVLWVDDGRRHGGYCLAPRIDVLAE